MIKQTISIMALSVLFATSCYQSKSYSTNTKDDRTTQVIKNNGETFKLEFDNQADLVVVKFDGKTHELKRKPSASGFWYVNDHYELRGKGNDLVFLKDGQQIYENEEELIFEQIKNDKGETLHLTFNNTEGTVKAYVNGGDEIELQQKKSASGIWYTNDRYELSGKGDDLTLTLDGQTIFSHSSDIQYVEAKNKKGETLNLTFNNSNGTVKAYLNGGEQIDLKEKKAASGIWYSNDNYELSGKGDHYILRKDNQVIFQN